MTSSTSPGASWIRDPRGRVLRGAAVAVAVLGQLAVLVPFTVASGLMAPLWASIALVVAWAATAAALVPLARRRPLATPLLPLGNLAVWWLAMTAGQRLLGWTP